MKKMFVSLYSSYKKKDDQWCAAQCLIATFSETMSKMYKCHIREHVYLFCEYVELKIKLNMYLELCVNSVSTLCGI